MPRIASPQDVHYLALEGGGGKGSTYLGAIQALEEKDVLPLNKPIGQNQIKGICGASAGAITALLLALGYDSKRLEQLLNRSEEFSKFFDPPAPGFYRSVNARHEPERKTDAPGQNYQDLMRFVKERREKLDYLAFIRERLAKFLIVGGTAVGGISGAVIGGMTAFVLAGILGLVRDAKINGFFEEHKDNPILAKIGTNVDAFVYNLIYDRGIFPGFGVRAFFQGIMAGYLADRELKRSGKLVNARAYANVINFEQLYEITGVELVFTGVNVTKGRPLYFSRRYTPKFPVVEAVAISMNLPILFKPIWNEAEVATGKDYPDPRTHIGFWVDGGLLNNLPIHAFDDAPDNARKSSDPDLRPLHPQILALRLTEGYADPKKNTEEAKRNLGPFDTLFAHMAGILAAVLYPAEEGQIRTPGEREQTIDLFTEGLETTEFAPSAEKRAGPVANAKQVVLDYFSKPKAGGQR